MPALIGFAVIALMSVGPAMAHGTEIHLSCSIWTFDPWIVAPLGAAGILYAAGVWRLGRRAVESRKTVLWRALAYGMGWLTVAGALLSPLHWLGEHLFTFHMIEHEILMAVSAPMVVVSRPIGALMWGLPKRLRGSVARMMKGPVVQRGWEWASRGATATALHAIAIWAWHAPVLFDAAVANVALHRLQHLSFFGTAVLFWWSVLWRSDRGVAAWHLFLTMLHTSILGALMALAPRVLYVVQTRASEAWGLTPLEDQQLAGMVMWIPAGTIYAGAALTLLALWISTSAKGGAHARPLSPFQ
jgi:putative membrane protein